MTQPNPIVIKIGGHEINDHDFLSGLAQAVSDYPAPVVIVHGGGVEISDMQRVMGIDPQYIDGVRVTDAASLKVVEMVLCGVVNKRLVRYLVGVGVEAVGLSGVDRGIVKANKMQHADQDMGFTGAVAHVRGETIKTMLDQGITPVIAPVSMGNDAPVSYNVNADHVAGAVAAAIGADRVVFITNVPGVLVDGEAQDLLDVEAAHALIDDGTIFGGMIPKVKTALHTVSNGVPQAVITNLAGLISGGGTTFVDRQVAETKTA